MLLPSIERPDDSLHHQMLESMIIDLIIPWRHRSLQNRNAHGFRRNGCSRRVWKLLPSLYPSAASFISRCHYAMWGDEQLQPALGNPAWYDQ